MNNKKEITKLLKMILAESKLKNAEALFISNESGLTRFANSTIHQNVAEQDNRVFFKVVIDKKTGVSSSNIIEPDSLMQTLQHAIEIAERARPNPYFNGLAKPTKYSRLTTYDPATAKTTPAARAAIVRKICRKATQQNLIASGALATSASEIAIINTNGVIAYQPLSSASINMIISSENSSGYAQGLSRKLSNINFESLAKKAFEKCLLSRNPLDSEPGKYDVILEPVAVANLLEWLSFTAFGSVPYHDNTSFLSGKKGKKIVARSVSIFDDGLNNKGIAIPFDFEGVPKKKVYFIKAGVAGSPVYDLTTAARYKTKSTGHGMPPGNVGGPIPFNVFMIAGKTPLKKIMSSVEKGILVTRFHYINGFLDTPNALFTGMTRDGTFLIEKGKIARGIKNLRFTESMITAFSNVADISRETELVAGWWGDIGCVSAPALYVRNFNFSGKTEF